MPKRIIVLGTMRSGTSLIAELIRRWGAYSGGEKNLWESDINDPRGYGYMEYIPLQNLNDQLLDNNDRIPPPRELLEERASDPYFVKKHWDFSRKWIRKPCKTNLRLGFGKMLAFL